MDKLSSANLKLGIIAGGQLGKMLIQEASKWDIAVYVMDNDNQGPASGIATGFVKGSNINYEDVYGFGKQIDVLTYEMENIRIDALQRLKSEGYRVVPDPDILKLIQDKGLQKEFYTRHQLPTASYKLVNDKSDIITAIQHGDISFPFVQKLRQGGYDGRGVAVINNQEEMAKLLDGASVIEEKVDIYKEIAVIAARNASGDIQCYPSVEMIFEGEANLVEKLACPADIPVEISQKAGKLATDLIHALQMEGLLAVEFFIDNNGELLINESAPRPHNSGHHTIESVVTSQYEQHIRAILDLPLGSTRQTSPAVMINLLGERGHEGPVKYEGLQEAMAVEGVKIHLYGKKTTRPMRKMGHVTVIDDSLSKAFEKAEKIKNQIKVKAWDNQQ
ncbi:MAG: 5-(carboxyamino)imidazole ribonucleotide synthase [Bacteroidetes bacterium]|jgi:5-(carboxyamino)imidazole ribonucleotide synthase|nr:5-(carboxyamino)imidazole ribonucleotide synthase [Bacteroidota bacterium]